MKYAKGPWKIAANSRQTRVLATHDLGIDTPVATIFGGTREERNANAHLIAMAPELLEFAINLRKLLPIGPAPDKWVPEWSRQLDEVLRKATGG